MLCVNPVPINQTGRHTIHAWEYLYVRCGRCIGCRINRAEEWTHRLEWELTNPKYLGRACFLTLTFSEDSLIKRWEEKKHVGLEKSDLQNFFKRLRQDLNRDIPKKDQRLLRYFACGEYGENRGRPHYHAVILGLSYQEEHYVEDNWPFGHVRVDPFNTARARYVAGYLLKNVDHEQPDFVLEKPFALMSKGMGLKFVESNKEFLLKGGNFTKHGNPIGLPRYFRKKIPDIPINKELIRESNAMHDARFEWRSTNIDSNLIARRSSYEKSLNQVRMELEELEKRYDGARRKYT